MALLTLLLLQQVVSLGSGDLLSRSLSNALHVPWFTVLTLLLWWVLGRPGPGRLLLVALLVAVVSEAVQLLTPRSASLDDVARNLFGAAPVILGVYLVRSSAPRAGGRRVRVRAWTAVGVGLLVTAVALLPAGRALLAYQQRDARFPVLLDPAEALRMPLLKSNGDLRVVPGPADWEGFAGRPVVLIRWANVRYPGLTFSETVPDWRGFRELVVPVYSPGPEPQSLTAAVGHVGTHGTSAYLRLPVRPGPQVLRYPLASLRDREDGEAARITHLVLHTSPAHRGQRLLIGAVRLE